MNASGSDCFLHNCFNLHNTQAMSYANFLSFLCNSVNCKHSKRSHSHLSDLSQRLAKRNDIGIDIDWLEVQQEVFDLNVQEIQEDVITNQLKVKSTLGHMVTIKTTYL